jgi:hypothetical protein
VGAICLRVAVGCVLVALGIANVAMYSRWHEVEDGVLWARAPKASRRSTCAGSPRRRAGIERGDVLLAVNGSPVETPADVVEYQHRGTRARGSPTRCCARHAAGAAVDAHAAMRGGSMYFVLAAVGFFTLIVGASVRLRRPRDQATLHFFWLCVAFFGVFTVLVQRPVRSASTGSSTGVDAAAVRAAAAAAAHFHDGLPQRSRVPPAPRLPSGPRSADVRAGDRCSSRRGRRGGARVAGQPVGAEVLARPRRRSDRSEPVYLFFCAVAALACSCAVPADHVATGRASCAGLRGARRSARAVRVR